ncbi:acyl carrier protein [Amycolatopsis balhimycina DSM 5908]|uniref:Acyl carrier protein n=1 Tax=Amycolatopsis balhimycina DSM 5908 TaxID=1081091 RepID=A0A428VV04_AMYBA|nr:acyl carrier protein [Amycolatopsis balhimycina]RSM34599.1 acyl carrier protein [Amycolatopsis balhimycina DSM 5908]
MSHPATAVFLAAASVRSLYPGDLTREHRLDGLGFDSLDRITLAVAIERATGRVVPDLVLATAGTLGHLIDQLTTDLEGTP